MPKDIVEKTVEPNGRSTVVLVTDPHDGSGAERWFVESQVRFRSESAARGFAYELRRLIEIHGAAS